MTTFNLRTVKLRPGEQFRDAKEVELEPLELGGEQLGLRERDNLVDFGMDQHNRDVVAARMIQRGVAPVRLRIPVGQP